MDLDGSKVLRILCYEEIAGQPKPLFRGKTTLELCQSWLQSSETDRQIPILDVNFNADVLRTNNNYNCLFSALCSSLLDIQQEIILLVVLLLLNFTVLSV